MTTQTKTTAPARPGRERTCTQCGTSYRSPRASRFCGNACRMKAKRKMRPRPAPEARPINPAEFSLIGRTLIRLGLAGPISPAVRSTRDRPVFALTIPCDAAVAEVREVFSQKGWGVLTEREIKDALVDDGIAAYCADAPETRFRKRSAAMATPVLPA